MLGEIVKFVKALREGGGGGIEKIAGLGWVFRGMSIQADTIMSKGDEYSGWHYGLRWPLLSGPKSGGLKQVWP